MCGYVVIFATVPLMAFKIERYQTSSSRERAIHLKLFCFQARPQPPAWKSRRSGAHVRAFMGNVQRSSGALTPHGITLHRPTQALVTILPAVWFCDVNLHPFSIYLGQNFYTAGAKIIIGGIVGDAFVINLLVDLGRPQDRIARWQARRARTQRAMNSLWKCNGDLYIAFRQQLVSKWIVLGLMFSSVVPALLPLIFVFLFIANWVDRFNLLRHLAPPPPQDDSIMRQLVQILLPIGVLLHMAVACTAYAMKVRRPGWARLRPRRPSRRPRTTPDAHRRRAGLDPLLRAPLSTPPSSRRLLSITSIASTAPAAAWIPSVGSAHSSELLSSTTSTFPPRAGVGAASKLCHRTCTTRRSASRTTFHATSLLSRAFS